MPSIYVFRMDKTNLYKIGFTSKSVVDRLVACQTGNPLKLTIEAVIPVKSVDRERDIHERFADRRLEGEWFKLDQDDIFGIINILSTYHELETYVRREFENL